MDDNKINNDTKNYINIKQYEMFTRVYGAEKLDTLVRLKESSKKLIYILENIQSKSCAKDDFSAEDPPISSVLTPILSETENSATDLHSLKASEELENQLNNIDSIEIKDEDDDCSVYKKLTRKCQCLNVPEFNDFVIHFNEDTKYYKSSFGEVIKNVRILKKFMYMGVNYTDNALIFLHKGLSDSAYTEKVEIAQACAYADICNIFDELSIVNQCIATTFKNHCSNDTAHHFTQNVASHLLYRIATVEEGRRYLNFSSKLTHELIKLLKKVPSKLDVDTLEILNKTVDLLNHQFPQHLHAYCCRSVETDCGMKALEALADYRQFMTLDEVVSQLEMLKKRSTHDTSKGEIVKLLPSLLILFKNMIVEYDNSEINILVTSILNNVILKSTKKYEDAPKTYVVADASTEAVITRDGFVQVPPKRGFIKKQNKSKNNNFSKILDLLFKRKTV